MAFDSNPQAVFHGAGFGELRQRDQATFNFSSASDGVFVASSTGSITVTDHVGRLALVKITGATAGAMGQLYPVDFADIAEESVTAGTDSGSLTNSIAISVGSVIMYLSRGSGTHLVLAGSDVSAAPGTSTAVVVTVYEIR